MKQSKIELLNRLGLRDKFSGDKSEVARIRDLNELLEIIMEFQVGIKKIEKGGLDSYLDYDLNVIDGLLTGGQILRLPQIPVKGRSVDIINTSGYVLYVYPSASGGKINGGIDVPIQIPGNGIKHTITCYENPLPGAWTWTPPAINQYDSGEITFNSPGGNNVISLGGPSKWVESNSFLTANAAAADSLNNLSIRLVNGGGGAFAYHIKPSPLWNQLTKIKLYTNLVWFNSSEVMFRIIDARATNFYTQGTNILRGTTNQSASTLVADTLIDQFVTAAPAPALPVLANNIGDAGTMYRELALSLPSSGVNSFGDLFQGQEIYNGVLCDKVYSRSLSIQMLWRDVVLAGAKARFFIEYN